MAPKRLIHSLVVLAAVATLALAAAVPGPAAAAEKVIRVGLWSAPGNLSAINADSSYAYFIVRFIYDTLVEMRPDTSFAPRLARSWEISPDGRTYTFHLDPKATWHDGKPVTADDVLFTVTTVATPGVQTNRGNAIKAIEGLDANGKMTGDSIRGVRVIDAHTIAVTTKTATDPARFLEQFGTGLFIIPKHLLENLKPDELAKADALLRPAAGSGPFRFVRYVPDQFVELVRYDRYYRGPARVDRILVRIASAPSISAALINGEIDVVAGPGIGEVPLQDWELIQKAANLRPVTAPSLGYQFLAINNARPSFQDVRVRRAIATGINVDLIVEQLFKGQAVRARGPFSPITPYENRNLAPIPHDPAAARKLLAEARWDPGRTVELLVPTGNALREQSASIIQANLQAIGMQVRIQRLDFPTVLSRVFKDDYDLVLLGWTDTFDPDHVSSTFRTGGQYNLSNFSDPKVDALIDQAAAERDPARRKVLYDELQVLFQEKVPVVFLYYPNMLAAVNRRLVNADPGIVPFEFRAAEWDIQEAK
ncbi:MAG: ABC transporter substrate-binding protein [Bacillota bacterium]